MGWSVLIEQSVLAGTEDRNGGYFPAEPLGYIKLTGCTMFGATIIVR